MADSGTWLERVRAGESFLQPDDSEFFELLIAAQIKAAAYNNQPIDTDFDRMQRLLGDVMGRVGKGVIVVPPILVDVGLNVEIGDNSFFNRNTTFLDTYPIRIGKDVMVGPNCCFYPVGHPVEARKRLVRDLVTGEKVGHLATGAPIVVEDGVWLGGSVVVIQGVTIGARSVIGAGSVVTKSIPPDVFAAGNPCRVIRPINN
jgi:maltose O-acetyltransferase